MTVRLSSEQAEALDFVAAVDERSIADVIRVAIDSHIAERREDALFQEGLRDRLSRAERLLGSNTPSKLGNDRLA
jgi:predicted transcriptional regulator